MLPKKNRVDKKSVDEIFKGSRSINFANLTFKFKIKNHPSNAQISFIVPKSVARLASKRNSLKRLGYNVLKKHISKFPRGLTGLFILKSSDILDIENEIKKILNKIN